MDVCRNKNLNELILRGKYIGIGEYKQCRQTFE